MFFLLIRPRGWRVKPDMTQQPALTVYYDGACPVCSREVAFYRRRSGAEHIAWIDAATCDASDLGPGLIREDALGRLHVRRRDGGLQSGADAFLAIWRRLPAFRPLARIFAWAPLNRSLEGAYGIWLRWRSWRRPADCPTRSNA